MLDRFEGAATADCCDGITEPGTVSDAVFDADDCDSEPDADSVNAATSVC